MSFTLPPDHQPGLRVPKGGSSCKSCEYLKADGVSCGNEYFKAWNGSDKLPAPADEYCSDWYETKSAEPAKTAIGRVILVRHGSTVLNATTPGQSAERIRGWLDVPLDDAGKEEAVDTANRIAGEYCVDQIYSSDLDRALETAQHLAEACNIGGPTQDDALRPWNVGDWAGEPTAEVLPHMQLLVEHPDVPAPGGESFSSFAKRFLRRFQTILAEAKATAKTIAVVSHTRNVQLARAWLASGAMPDLSFDADCMNDYSTELKPGDYLALVPDG